MASAQVLPNPGASSARKQGHLEAGKRRLEEFRKKKAEQRKKAASTGQLPLEDGDIVNKHSLQNEGSMFNSEKDDIPMQESTVSQNVTEKLNQAADINLTSQVDACTDIAKKGSAELERNGNKDEGSSFYGSTVSSERNNGFNDVWLDKNTEPDDNRSNEASTKHLKAVELALSNVVADGVKRSTSYSPGEAHPGYYHASEFANNPESSVSLTNLSGNVSNAVKYHDAGFRNYSSSGSKDGMQDNMISESIFRHLNVESSATHSLAYSTLESTLTSHSSNRYSLPSLFPGTASVKSRPSFLDSLNISRASSNPYLSSSLPSDINKDDSEVDKKSSTELKSPFLSEQPATKISAEASVLEYNSEETKFQILASKDDDFAALEQHIEDLTQEKFALKRALETSQVLTESLASENSSLTNSFNDQGKVVNQLKSDMERLQEEIKAQMLAFESLKMEYANAQLECNAADERAKILASEVINLEEKALRLRSNELKLEKQLESRSDEISSYRRKLSSLEKANQDFQSTIEALQEEKKVLQSKIWNASVHASTSEQSPVSIKKDACTFTSDLDLGNDNQIGDMDGIVMRNASEQPVPSFSGRYDVSGPSSADSGSSLPPDGFGSIPNDQMKMVENIRSLISELALEKERLLQSLAVETSLNCKLKDLNKELSHKLEVQTQRFELLATQNKAKENLYTRPTDTDKNQDTVEYADEGDEVVERVLSWIMKLFPGGPSKRRTSKLL